MTSVPFNLDYIFYVREPRTPPPQSFYEHLKPVFLGILGIFPLKFDIFATLFIVLELGMVPAVKTGTRRES